VKNVTLEIKKNILEFALILLSHYQKKISFDHINTLFSLLCL
jgi:hypothetical protein